MTSDGDDNEKKASSCEPLDPIDYHRRLVSAILDIGVDHASPLQIYERMTLPKDRNNPSFLNLQLGQIKSHLQRFRMVYKNGAQMNAEKIDFLDDYDNFVDFGLDAAAARNDESNSSVMGGRIIGLVSRMVMVQDGVYSPDLSKNPPMQAPKFSDISALAARKNIDKRIPKLSPSEKDSPLGQSIQLVAGLLEHLNNHIKTERQRATQGCNQEDPTTRALSTADQPVPANHFQIALSNGLQAQGRPLKLPLLPPQQLLVHPEIAEQILKQQQQQQEQQLQRQKQHLQSLRQSYASATGQIPKPPSQQQQKQQQHQQPPRPYTSQQQQYPRGRARVNSLSDVSSIGGDHDQSLITEEDLNFALLMPKSKTESHIYLQSPLPVRNQRLGKFIPVKEETDTINVDENIQIQGRVYPPRPTDQVQQHVQQQAYWHQGHQNQNPPTQAPPTIGSFEIPSPVVLKKTVVHLASQAFTVPTAVIVEPSKQIAATNVTLTKSLLVRNLPREIITAPQHPERQQKKTRKSKLRELSRLPARKLLKYPPSKWRERYKHSSKKNIFKKLHKAITEISRRRGNDTRNNQSNEGSNDRKMSGNMNITRKTTYTASDDHSSVVSSLSSSSDSSLESEKFSEDYRGIPATGKIREHQIQGEQVSVTRISVKSNDDKDDWMFDRFKVPRNVRLVVYSKEQQQQQQSYKDFEQFDEGEDDDSSWCTKRSTSLEDDCRWGIVKGVPGHRPS